MALGSAAVLTIPETRQTHVVSSAVILHLKIYLCMRQRRTHRDSDKSQSFHLPWGACLHLKEDWCEVQAMPKAGPEFLIRGPRRVIDYVNHRGREISKLLFSNGFLVALTDKYGRYVFALFNISLCIYSKSLTLEWGHSEACWKVWRTIWLSLYLGFATKILTFLTAA